MKKRLFYGLFICIMMMFTSSMIVQASYSDEVILEYNGVNYGKIIYSEIVDEGKDTFNIETDYGIETYNWSYRNVAQNSICTIEPSNFGGYVIAGLWEYTPSEEGTYIVREDSVPIQLLSNEQVVMGYGYGYEEHPIQYGSPTSFTFGDNIGNNPIHGETHSYSLYADSTLYILQCEFYNNEGDIVATTYQPCFIKNEEYISQNSSEITVLVHGEKISFDQPPIIIDGRTLVPVRAVFESLGVNVEWIPDSQTVLVQKDGRTVTLKIDSNVMRIGNEEIVLDVPAQIINGRTLVPVRAVAEAFECIVDWDSATYTVIINDKQ